MATTTAPSRTLWQRISAMFDANEKYLRGIWPQVRQINALEAEFEQLTQQDLQDRLRKIRSNVIKAREEVLAQQAELPPVTATEDKRTREEEVVAAEKVVLDRHLPEVFAAVREAAKRTLSMRHFDVQMLGGIVLHEGRIAEMKTGEGKTLTATCPLVLNALAGRGAHLVTVNDYLARRDAEWMGKIYVYLGLTVGVIQHDLERAERQAAYGCDITYITNHEIGFDYLRDHSSAWRPEHLVIRELYYAIVDEVDSILIDEARVPLIISASRGKPVEKYRKVQEVVARLIVGEEDEEAKTTTGDVIVDEKTKNATLTEDGQRKVEIGLGIDNLNDSAHIEDMHLVNSALKANFCYKRDTDYIVGPAEGGQIGVVIVDTFTGRPQPGRRWSDGLHQAIEAKERVTIQDEQQTIATVTYQNFFLMYQKLAGMTGTAKTEEGEFVGTYKMPVTVVPTNRPMVRLEHSDIVYKNEEWKLRGIVAEVVQYYCRRQPVLVGTRSVETSERISARLKPEPLRLALQFTLLGHWLTEHEKAVGKDAARALRERSSMPLEAWRPRDVAAFLGELGVAANLDTPEGLQQLASVLEVENVDALADVVRNGVPHEVLNARYHEREAEIVAQAGRLGAVTIATNMAGRGTDIVLGGNPEPDVEAALARRGIDPKSLQATLFINAGLKGDPAEAAAMAEAQGGLPRPVLAEVASIRAAWQAEHDEVVAVGGLHILGTERLESRRIDNQLRGRSGRQGDPGGARFYVSLQDELMRLFGPDRWGLLMNNWPEEQPVEAKLITRSMDTAQKKVEARNFDMRKNTLRYDDVMNVQRLHIYSERHRILEGVDLRSTVGRMLQEMVSEVVATVIGGDRHISEQHIEEIWRQLNQRFPLKDQLAFGDLLNIERDLLVERLTDAAERAYDDKENDFIRAIVEFELAASIHETLAQVTERSGVVMVLNTLWPLEDYLPARLEGVGDSRVPEVLLTVAREALEERPKEFIAAVIDGRLRAAVAQAVAALEAGTPVDEALAALRASWPLDLARELAGAKTPAEVAAQLPAAAQASLARGGWHFVQDALRRQMELSVDQWVPATCDLDALLADLGAQWPLAGLEARNLEQYSYLVIEDRLRRAADEAVANQGREFLALAAKHRAEQSGLANYTVADLELEAAEAVVARAAEDAHRKMAAGIEEGDEEQSLEAGDLSSLIEQLEHDWALKGALDPWSLEQLPPEELRAELVSRVRSAVRARGEGFLAETARQRLALAIEQAVGAHYSLDGLCNRLNQRYELPAVFTVEALEECQTSAEIVARLSELAEEAFAEDEDNERQMEFAREIRGLVDDGWNARRLVERLNQEYKPTPKLDAKELAGVPDEELVEFLLDRLASAEAVWRDTFALELVRRQVQVSVDEALEAHFDVRTLSRRLGELWPLRPDAVRASKIKGWPYGDLSKRLKDTLNTACRAEEWRFVRRFVLRHMEDGLHDALARHCPREARRQAWNIPALCEELGSSWPIEEPLDPRSFDGLSSQAMVDYLLATARRLYAASERAFIRGTAAHRFGLNLDRAVAERYSLDRAADEVNRLWRLGEAIKPTDLVKVRSLLASDATAADAEIRRLGASVLPAAEETLLQQALERRLLDSVDEVLDEHYNTGDLVDALLGEWPLDEVTAAGLADEQLRRATYRSLVDGLRQLATRASGSLRRRLVYHNLRASAGELDFDRFTPQGEPAAWYIDGLIGSWNRVLPLADAVSPVVFGQRLLAAALAPELTVPTGDVSAAALEQAVRGRLALDVVELTRQERRPHAMLERLAQRWPVSEMLTAEGWQGKSPQELRELLSQAVLSELQADRAAFLRRAVAQWLPRTVTETVGARWPEGQVAGPWVLAQVCDDLERRWRVDGLLHPGAFRQLEREQLIERLTEIGEGLPAATLTGALSAELVASGLKAAATLVAGETKTWDPAALTEALAAAGGPRLSAAELGGRLTRGLLREQLALAAETLEPRIANDYETEVVQEWVTGRVDRALDHHCSLTGSCEHLARLWPVGDLEPNRLAQGNHPQIREALQAALINAAHRGGGEFVREAAERQMTGQATADVVTAFRWDLLSGWLRQSVTAEQAEWANPNIAPDRWDLPGFVQALERAWPIAGRLQPNELAPLNAEQVHQRALGVLRQAFDGHEPAFLRATTEQRLALTIREAIRIYATLDSLIELLNRDWPRETRTSVEELAKARLAELTPTIAARLERAGQPTDEVELRRVLERSLPAGRGGPAELEPIVQQIASRWPALGDLSAYELDEKLITEALRTRLWAEFDVDPRAFVKAVALEDVPRQLERRLMLEAIDTNWCNHLEAMDYLREGIGLRAHAQTDPFIEYRREGRRMFENLLGRVAETVVMGLFETTDEHLVDMHQHGRLGLQIAVNYENVRELAAKAEDLTAGDGRAAPAAAPMAGGPVPAAGGQRPARGPARGGEQPARAQTVTVEKVGRNEPCPCGSGKKYKFCCGR